MCKSKYQVLYTYLLAAFVALVAVANHFNFRSTPSADALLTDSITAAELTTLPSAEAISTPVISRSFASTNSSSQSAKTLPHFSAERVSSPSVDAGSGFKIYQNLLYAHSHYAGATFKQLSVGSRFEATIDGRRATYEIVSRTVYTRDYLNNNASLRLSLYHSTGLALMTCGNGSNDDSGSRLVLIAVEV